MKKKTKTNLIIAAPGRAAVGLANRTPASSKLLGKQRASRRSPVAVEIQPIGRSTIQNIGNFTGSLIPKSRYVLSPKISGKLTRLHVNIGDRVSRRTVGGTAG